MNAVAEYVTMMRDIITTIATLFIAFIVLSIMVYLY
jgi:hypothetical protein